MQIIDEYSPKSFLDRLGGGIASAGQAGGKALAEYMQLQKTNEQQEANKRMAAQLTGYPEDFFKGASPDAINQLLKFGQESLLQEQKAKQAEDLQSLKGADPFKERQQDRLRQESVRKYYHDRMQELNKKLEGGRYSDRDATVAEIDELANERDYVLGFGDDEDQEENVQKRVKKYRKGKKKLPKFSAENPEHRKKAEQLYKQYNDKEKVREILSREFSFE